MRLRTLLLGAAVAATAAVSLPTPAFAWSGTIIPSETGSVRCDRGRMCLFYNSNQQGAKKSFGGKVHNFIDYRFEGPGAGSGLTVKNNAASITNGTDNWVTVYFNSNYAGNRDWVHPYSYGRLRYTYNNNASFDYSRPN